MARQLSTAFRQAFWASETEKVAIILLEVSHETEIAVPFRFALNTVKVRRKQAQTTVDGAHSAGDSTIAVADDAGFADQEAVTIALDDGEFHDTTVSGTPAGNVVTISQAIPVGSSVSDGAVFATYFDYLPFPFEVELPKDQAGRAPHVKLRIDNIDRTIADQLRKLTSSPTAKLMIVLSDSPETVEFSTPEMIWQTTTVTPQVVEATLVGARPLSVSYPMEDFSPSTFPALFKI